MKRILIVLVLFTGIMAHAIEIKKDTVYTSLTSFLKTLNTTKKTQATYYFKLTTLDSSQIKLRIDLKQLKVDIPIYKSAHFDIEKLLRLTNEKQLTINKKLEVFNAKVKEKIKAEKQLGVLNNELATLKKADSTNYDSIAIAEVKIKADDKAKEVSNLLNRYNQLFEEYEQMVNDALGNIRTDYQNRLTKVIEEAYDKLESKDTRFQTFDDDAWFYDIRINLLKVDATRPMKVSYTVRGGEKREEKITPGDHYYIMHFTEFGAWYEKEKIVPLFKNIKLSEASRNPFLLDEQFALVCNDKDRTQHYINMVVDYKNYHFEREEKEIESKFENITLDNVQWISQLDGMFKGTTCWKWACCNRASNKILKKSGATTDRSMQVVIAMSPKEDCEEITIKSEENFEEGIKIIETSLKDHKLPILIGVHHPSSIKNKDGDITGWEEQCSGNIPNITNHYVVVIGMGYDPEKEKNYFIFYEVGTSKRDKGISAENILYVDNEFKTIKGKTKYKSNPNYYYVVTEIRKNHGKRY